MLCKFNVTVVFVLIPFKNIIYLKDNALSGLVGKYMQKILDVPKGQNKCTLLAVDEMGKNYKNGTSDGALNLLVRNIGDFAFRKEAHLFINNDLQLTPTISEEHFQIIQLVSTPSEYEIKEQELIKGLKRFLSIQLISFHFLGFILMQILMVLMIYIHIYQLSFKINYRHLISLIIYHEEILLDNFLKKAVNFFKLVTYIVLSYSIFHNFFKNIAANNIKTSKIIVDTSSLILDENSLLSNYRNVCWFHNEIDSDIVRDSPANSFLQQVWFKKNSPIPCFFRKNSPYLYLNFLKNHFIMSKRIAILLLIQLFYKFIPYKVWISPHIFHKFSTFYYVSKRSPSYIKDEINKFSLHIIQFQLLDYNQALLFHGLFYDGRRVIEDLQVFINQNTRFDQLSIDDYRSYFIFYILINLLISFAFLLHHLFSYLKFKLEHSN